MFKILKSLLQNRNDEIKINILTRTSARPNSFKKCRLSIENQSHSNIRHLVSYDREEDLSYLNEYPIELEKVYKIKERNDSDIKFEPYNLYCNELLQKVEEGWIMFLDDDDFLTSRRAIQSIVKTIKQNDEDTLIIWQTMFPSGTKLPPDDYFVEKEIKIEKIDTACFIFHSKYKDSAKWDEWWAADFRYIRDLSIIIPKQYWLKKIITKKSNTGDKGRRNDIKI